ncbi:3-ketoacyl-ACP reductase [Frankia sp. CcI49]|uniref:mycofactocin-coupled SDR family oxidoreductase n=1 Tax=Frankia sp. CcI49 TaxID=1745382 RepID=UPI000975C3E5|nr:mycofactocin-coupled SDR family oxidoreductase [Frankia sp. CcI49]ONH60012.1 3-ketoacyl-ACP reductase [Frankia sp. CcI49]
MILAGKVAFITGAARGQGRSHAVRLAQEGADIIAVDICADIDSVGYPLATPDDLKETVRQVEALGGGIHPAVADVRDPVALQAALDAGVAALGPVDIVVANAGIAPFSAAGAGSGNEWRDVLDVNLTGTYNTVRAAAPAMVERGAGGSIVITSSTAGLTGMSVDTPGVLGYTASKHGLVGLMRTWANALAPHRIRVNTVHPSGVGTPMVMNDMMLGFLRSDPNMVNPHALPVAMLECSDISEAVLWLASDHARYVTGVTLPVDAGFVNKR